MTIVAVVVTYNRKNLLYECIEAILNQSYSVEKLLIIDNNSTDGTYEFLTENKIFEDNKVIYRRLEKNIGGAGGFYEGIKMSQEYKPQYVWIMDDDTIPTSNCLSELVEASKKVNNFSYLASAVYGINNEFMNVPTIDTSKTESGYAGWYKYLEYGIIKIHTATFVSLLLNNDAILSVGYPMKNYFIWGDDSEYTFRLTKYYSEAYFVGASKVIHKRKIGKTLRLEDEDSVNRINNYYYMIRNTLINTKEYEGILPMVKYFIKNQIKSFCYLLKPKSKLKIRKFLIVQKALLVFIFGLYDKDAFKKRFDVNVVYKR